MYQLSTPAPELRPYIEHYWFVSADARAPLDLRVSVYVDARADLVFNLGVAYTRTVLGGRARTIRRSNLDAQRDRPIRIAQRGAVEIAGVRFHTAGVAPFVSAHVDAWNNRVVPVADVFGEGALALEQALRVTPDRAGRTALLDAFFRARLDLTPAKQKLQGLKARIEAEGGLMRIDTLCDEGGISIRQLDRLFRAQLGFSPKTFSRIVRFQRALTMLKTDPGCTLAEVAAACGYYDQPHFVREFKAHAGVVPRAQVGYFPPGGPADFSPNVVQFVQDPGEVQGDPAGRHPPERGT